MTSSSASFVCFVLLTTAMMTAADHNEEAVHQPAADRTSGSASVDQHVVDRKKRSEADDETAGATDELAAGAFVGDLTEQPSSDVARWNNEQKFDETGRQWQPTKRGRWSKNNVQMWGKRSLSLPGNSGHRVATSGSAWPSSERGAAEVGLRRIRSPAVRGYGGGSGAGNDGVWSKRKKTWEKNNFKMWGKRTAGLPIEDAAHAWNENPEAAERYLALIDRVIDEQRQSRPETGNSYAVDDAESLRPVSVRDSFGPDGDVELAYSSLSSDVDGGRKRPLPLAVELRHLLQRPKKKTGWSSNNVHMWG